MASISDNSDPKPIGSGKDKFPFNKLISLGMPCVNISTPTVILNKRIKILSTGP